MNMQILVHNGLFSMHYILKLLIFGRFEVENVSKEIRKFTGHKNIKTNIFRIQGNNSIMCG